MLPEMLSGLPDLIRHYVRNSQMRRRSVAKLSSIGPRILPFTIVAMAALLLVKLVDLTLIWLPESSTRSMMQAAATMFAPAHAAGSEAPKPDAGKPEASKAEPGKSEPGKAEAGKTEGGKPEGSKDEAAAKPGEANTPLAPGATSGSAARPIGEVAAALGPGMSETERALLTDLRNRRQELDKREAALAERANVLTAAEGRLATRLDEMKGLQSRLESLEKARQVQTDANWRGLVKVYEDMKPRDAAVICNDLDTDVLIPVLDRMKDAKVAILLAAMDPMKAREATALLAKRRAQATMIPPPTPAPAKAATPTPVAPPAAAPSGANSMPPGATPAAATPASGPAPGSPSSQGGESPGAVTNPPASPGGTAPSGGKRADATPSHRQTGL